MNKDRLKFRTPYYLPDPDDKDQFIGFEYWNAVDGRPQMMVSWGKDEQCTGLKDKNGNLIYEGDIVLAKHSYKSRPGKFIIKWGQAVGYIVTAGFWLFDFSPITLETARKGDDFPESSEIEIIGNIHEQAEQKENK